METVIWKHPQYGHFYALVDVTLLFNQLYFTLLSIHASLWHQVGYCQGMVFAAGILLMYLPEEPAFR